MEAKVTAGAEAFATAIDYQPLRACGSGVPLPTTTAVTFQRDRRQGVWGTADQARRTRDEDAVAHFCKSLLTASRSVQFPLRR